VHSLKREFNGSGGTVYCGVVEVRRKEVSKEEGMVARREK